MSDQLTAAALSVLEQVAATFAEALGYEPAEVSSAPQVLPAGSDAALIEVSGAANGVLVAALSASEIAKHGDDGKAACAEALAAAVSQIPNLTVVRSSAGVAPHLAASVSLLEEGQVSATLGWAAEEAPAAPAPAAAAPAAAAPAATPADASTKPSKVPSGMRLLHDVRMRVTAELGRAEMSVRELLALAPGSVIELDSVAGSPIDVLVNNKLVARGEVIVIDEEFGVRVTEIVVSSDED